LQFELFVRFVIADGQYAHDSDCLILVHINELEFDGAEYDYDDG
jgi:hypothetical protein